MPYRKSDEAKIREVAQQVAAKLSEGFMDTPEELRERIRQHLKDFSEQLGQLDSVARVETDEKTGEITIVLKPGWVSLDVYNPKPIEYLSVGFTVSLPNG